MTTDYLLKGKETAPMDIYSQHDSKAGTEMSAEVTEILDNCTSNEYSKEVLNWCSLILFGF